MKTHILNEIISKGGLYSKTVKMYLHDDELAHRFIIECSEQCHNKLAQEMWGDNLVNAIKEYAERTLEERCI